MKAKITEKEYILRKIREASYKSYDGVKSNIDYDSKVFAHSDDNPLVIFAENLINIGGNFVYCQDEHDFAIKLAALLDEKEWLNPVCHSQELAALLAEKNIVFRVENPLPIDSKVGISSCEYLVSRLGSIVVSSWSNPGRQIHAYPEIHIVVAKASQVVLDIGDAIKKIRKKYSVDFPSEITLITGPSRTADIEKTLVMGAHGPKELIVFVIAD